MLRILLSRPAAKSAARLVWVACLAALGVFGQGAGDAGDEGIDTAEFLPVVPQTRQQAAPAGGEGIRWRGVIRQELVFSVWNTSSGWRPNPARAAEESVWAADTGARWGVSMDGRMGTHS